MTVFLDTSALLAVLDADDLYHGEAETIWLRLLASDELLLTSNYVLVETTALAQSRLGLEAVRALAQDIMPALQIHWIDEALHEAGLHTTLEEARRKLSLVDCTSFEVMRRHEVTRAFAFDRHFAEQGFELLRA